LLGGADVRAFIGSPAYLEHKDKRFPAADEMDLTVNQAFQLSDPATRARFEAACRATSALYYRGQPPSAELLARVQADAAQL
jgi:hypothetical protein